MEAMTYEIIDIIEEQRDMRAVQKANTANIGEKDQYGFAFEPGDSISMNVLGFRETAMRLYNEAVETFRVLREYNRHSPVFYQMSAELENIISQLGSVCITKAVIEQQDGKEDRFLSGLSIEWLRQRVAFNFRKCYSSYMESMAYLNFNQKALHLSLRWSALDKRLIATAEKIEKIKNGQLKIELVTKDEKLQAQVEALENQTPPQEQNSAEKNKEAAPSAFAAKGRALSIDKSAVKENTAKASDNAEDSAEIQIREAKPASAVDAISETTPADATPADANPIAEDSSKVNPAAANQLPNVEEPENHENSNPAFGEKSAEKSKNSSATGSEHSSEKQNKSSEEEPTETAKLQDNPSVMETNQEDAKETAVDERNKISEESPDIAFPEDEENLPSVSEEFVRRMSELINSPEFLKWPFPEMIHSE